MVYWTYVEPGENGEEVRHMYSEDAIIEMYWPYWKEQMEKVGRYHLINHRNCIDDFVVVFWAEKVECPTS